MKAPVSTAEQWRCCGQQNDEYKRVRGEDAVHRFCLPQFDWDLG